MNRDKLYCRCYTAIQAFMKGGRRSSTWENTSSKWNSGSTKTIRVPAALIPEILEYARWLDQHSKSSLAQDSQGDFSCNVVLQAIDKYVEWRRDRQHPNQYSTKLNMNARTWDELRKFRAMVERGRGGGGRGGLRVRCWEVGVGDFLSTAFSITQFFPITRGG